jgi:hypothetical protein
VHVIKDHGNISNNITSPITTTIDNLHTNNKSNNNGTNKAKDQAGSKKHHNDNVQQRGAYNFTNVPFSANLTAVLNDPRKDRVKTANLFTKTWGSDFVEEPSFPEFATRKFPIIMSSDFKPYFSQISPVCVL